MPLPLRITAWLNVHPISVNRDAELLTMLAELVW